MNLLHISAQYPFYTSYTGENGFPSNEVYSIIQDQKGFIWIGCDAGLFKYDGIKYITYRSTSQRSRPITGLNISTSGTIYGYNFHGQVFYVKNDSLYELKHPGRKVSNINTDLSGNVFINHPYGISIYNEKTNSWQNYTDFKKDPFTNSAKTDETNTTYFLTESGIGKISKKKFTIDTSDIFIKDPPGTFIMECIRDEAWIFSNDKNITYRYKKGKLDLVDDKNLKSILANRKITNVVRVNDNELWICTYRGMIIYNPFKGTTELLYPGYTFSDVLVDREGNHWLSTLQTGIMKIPDMEFKVWNTRHSDILTDQLTKISGNSRYIYASTSNGSIIELDKQTHQLVNYHTGEDADVQCLEYIHADKSLYFYLNHKLYRIKNGKLSLEKDELPPVKSIIRSGENYFFSSSFGAFYTPAFTDKLKEITSFWTREIIYHSKSKSYYLATNNGLLQVQKHDLSGQFEVKQVLFKNVQVTSLSADENIYVLTFDGKIFRANADKPIYITDIPEDIQAYKLRNDKEQLYVATNRGLWIYDLLKDEWTILNKQTGLTSNNIQDIFLDDTHVWMATGNGLQQIPKDPSRNAAGALLYIPTILVDGNKIADTSYLHIRSRQQLTFIPQVSNYRSNGNYKYAYRFVELDSQWTYLPADIGSIELNNIPGGEYTLEIKVVDYWNRDSENRIRYTVKVQPPFWKTPWFCILLFAFIILLLYQVFNLRIKRLKKQQLIKIEKLNLEKELQLTQQTALKAQMNPHFIFNVLNSIKGYIYKNDKTNALLYLSNFSDLIRTILDMSSKQYVTLEEELSMLELYIKLEEMLLQKDFTYSIQIHPEIDIRHVEIPSMILQPFVENSFKHGLRHKNGNKELRIGVSAYGPSTLVINIEDNGIGREASTLINSKTRKRNSFATDAIRNRVDLINKEGKQHINIYIRDLYDKEDQPSGTGITLKITWNEKG